MIDTDIDIIISNLPEIAIDFPTALLTFHCNSVSHDDFWWSKDPAKLNNFNCEEFELPKWSGITVYTKNHAIPESQEEDVFVCACVFVCLSVCVHVCVFVSLSYPFICLLK